MPLRQNVLGVNISTTSYEDVAETCAQWITQRVTDPCAPSRYVCIAAVQSVMEARRHTAIRTILNEADIVTPDGMPLVWALRSFGARQQERVYGPTLMLRLCAQAEQKGHRIFLYGGQAQTLDSLRRNLLRQFPKLILAGSYLPPFRPLTEEEEQEASAAIRRASPDLVFVGIGTPKQELWMAQHKTSFPGVVMLGVGAAFDFHAGRVRQAPAWMQALGLEWFYRLTQEPARLWKRYILVTPWFIPFWVMQKLSMIMYDVACGERKPHSPSNAA
jgi:N-acetylglucosaminyldiphosphoundecaprenol N-acetyl-beta-D-mannosaminyltransferase